jgi:small redox-active disulfide protein 2
VRKIQVLGTGCPKCEKLAKNAEAAAAECGGEYRVEKVTDINDILEMHVVMTPALAIDGVVKAVGRVPSPAEIKEMLNG